MRRESGDIEMRIDDGFTPRPVPQIHARLPWAPGPTGLSLRADSLSDRDAFVKLIDESIAKGAFAATHVLAVRNGLRSISLANHQGKNLRVKAETEEQGQQFLGWFLSVWLEYKAVLLNNKLQTESLGGELEILTVSRPDDYQRAIAKTALNYLCYVKGAGFALRPEFDPLREYVLGNNLVVDQALLSAGGIAQDTRFVMPVSPDVGAFVPSPRHMIFLLPQGSELLCLVTYYGKHHYAVRMGTLPAVDEVFAAHEFSEDRTQNAPVDVYEMMRRVRARHAESLPSREPS